MPRFITFLLASTYLSLIPVAAMAADITDAGDLPGGIVNAQGAAISGDGLTAAGQSRSGSGIEAFIWTSTGGIVGLGDLPGGGVESRAYAVSMNGAIIVGYSESASGAEAFRWTAGGGMVGLGDLPGGSFNSNAFGISGDGTIIVGTSNSASGTEAFRWTAGGGMVGLGDLPGGIFNSNALGISGDGTVIVGNAVSAAGTEAFRWTAGGGMVGLGDLAGGIFYSEAKAVNYDGTVIVGRSTSASGTEAFRWTAGGGMVGLGDLVGGGFSSIANAVNSDGSVVVGRGTSAAGSEAFRWTAGGGVERIADILAAESVDLTGWVLTEAKSVDNSGDIIVGVGTYLGNTAAFIANLAAGGVTTPTALAEDLSPVAIPAQQGAAMMGNSAGQSLFASTMAMSTLARVYDAATQIDLSSIKSFNDILPAAGTELRRKWSSYLVGTLGVAQDNDFDNHDLNGQFGFITQLNDNLAIGGGIIGSSGTTELLHGGESTLDAKGFSAITAYEHDGGLRIYGTAFAADLNLETHRRYRNGAGFDTSIGNTNGFGYGAALRLGYQAAAIGNISLMPYGEVQATHTQYDAYAENGGAFPATVAEQSVTQATSKLGLEASYTATPTLTLGGRLAWAHRFSDDNDGTQVSTTGFSGTVSGNDSDTDWAEGTITTGWAITPSTSLSAELSGRSGETQEPLAQFSLGLKVDF